MIAFCTSKEKSAIAKRGPMIVIRGTDPLKNAGTPSSFRIAGSACRMLSNFAFFTCEQNRKPCERRSAGHHHPAPAAPRTAAQQERPCSPTWMRVLTTSIGVEAQPAPMPAAIPETSTFQNSTLPVALSVAHLRVPRTTVRSREWS